MLQSGRYSCSFNQQLPQFSELHPDRHAAQRPRTDQRPWRRSEGQHAPSQCRRGGQGLRNGSRMIPAVFCVPAAETDPEKVFLLPQNWRMIVSIMRSPRVVKPLIGISCCTKQFGIFGMPNHAASDTYVRATDEVIGGVPVLVPANGPMADIDTLLDRLDGIILTGSRSNVQPTLYDGPPHAEGTPEDPARDGITLPLIRAAIVQGRTAARHLPWLSGAERRPWRLTASAPAGSCRTAWTTLPRCSRRRACGRPRRMGCGSRPVDGCIAWPARPTSP